MNPGLIALLTIVGYLGLLIALGVLSNRYFRGTATDYFLASRGIGSFLLLMSLFGTTMTAFAMVGSTAEAYTSGIGVYGQMVSWSGLIHSLCFFLVGIRLWSFGKRHGYSTQIQFFRDRFESDRIGLVLFPALVGLVVPYLLVGVIGGGITVEKITPGAMPGMFAATRGGVPFWLGSAVICLVVLFYVFFGGVRGTAWANAFQTIVFVVLGVVTFRIISDRLGGVENATRMVAEYNPAHLKIGATEGDEAVFREKLAAFEAGASPIKPKDPKEIPPLVFLTYMFIPLSVAMFPHLFQHWMTAKTARTFRLSVVVHPLLMLLVWLPCVLIGVWATSAVVDGAAVLNQKANIDANAVLSIMVRQLSHPLVGGLLTAGVLAAIMSSLDSQFLCIGSIFTHDIVDHYIGRDRLSDRQKVVLGRCFVIGIVAVTYVLALFTRDRSVFTLGIWCFTGFASLSPLVFAAIYWRRTTKAGAYACVLTTIGVGGWLFSQSKYGADGDYLFLDMMPVATVLAASTAALVIVSLLTRPPSSQTLSRFFSARS